MKTKVNKLVKLAAAGLFLIALAINIKVTLEDPFVMVSEDAIAQTTSSSSSDTTDDCNACIPVDCPWWNPFCDDWDKADPVTTWETVGPCSIRTTDCYPGTKSCSESSSVNCP